MTEVERVYCMERVELLYKTHTFKGLRKQRCSKPFKKRISLYPNLGIIFIHINRTQVQPVYAQNHTNVVPPVPKL